MNQGEISPELEQQFIDRLKREYVLVPRVKAAFFAGIAVALIGGTGGVSYGVAKSVISSSAAYLAQKELDDTVQKAGQQLEDMTTEGEHMKAEGQRMLAEIKHSEQEGQDLLDRLRERLAGRVLGHATDLLQTGHLSEDQPLKVLEVSVNLEQDQNVLLVGHLAMTVTGERTKTRVWLARDGERISPNESYFGHKHTFVHTPAYVDAAPVAGPVTYQVWAAKGDGPGQVRPKEGFLQITALN